MTIKKIEAGRVITQNIDEFVGTRGTIWYDETTGEMRLYDGNPGGIPIGGGGGGHGYTGSQGYTGSKGDIGTPGQSVRITGTTSTYTALETPYLGAQWDGYITLDNGHLNVWDGAIWLDVGNITGYTGSQGDRGYTGSQGEIGYTGSASTATGYTGSQGIQGVPGQSVRITGTTSTYADLITPYPGPQWDGYITIDNGHLNVWDGAIWLDVGNVTGSQGYTGSKGDLGYTGSIGPRGYDGSRGYTGSYGDLGYTGSQGALGFTGSQGDIGYVGSKGDRGDQGLTGQQGVSVTIQGSTSTVAGLPAIGNPGDGWIVTDSGDLYYWNVTASTWNDLGKIVGPQGDQGYTGSQGDVGYVGSRGETGYDGSQGERGYDGSTGYTGSYGDLGYTGSIGDRGYDGSQGYTGSQGYSGSRGYTGSGIIGLRSNNTDTVTLVTGFKFIPEDNKIQDLGTPSNRFGKLYLAGQTIFLGDTILSVADDGELQLLKPTGELEKIAVSSLKLGSTGTDGVVFSSVGGVLSIAATVTNFTNIATTGTVSVSSVEASTSTTTGALVISGGVGIGGDISLSGKILSDVVNINGTNSVIIATSGSNYVWAFNSDGTTAFPYYRFPASTGTAGQILVDLAGDGNLSWQNQTGGGGTGQAYDQVLFTTSSVTFANITIAPGGGITFPTGAPQTSRAPKMVVDDDFINAPDYDAFFATLIPGDFYWSVTYSQIKILVDFGGYYDWQDLTVYAA